MACEDGHDLRAAGVLHTIQTNASKRTSGNEIIYRNVDGCRMIGYFRPGGSGRKA